MSKKESKSRSVAYTYTAGAQVLKTVPPQDQFMFLTGMALAGKIKGGANLPKKPVLPPFWIVGTDKESIKQEVIRLIDNLFQAWNNLDVK